MIDVSGKQISLRTASAEGMVLCGEETIDRIKNNTLPKGNLFDVAKASGLLAAKNTSQMIPHCHPVSIDSLDISFELIDGGKTSEEKGLGVLISVEGKSIGRTGIEMEVLSSVSVCALTIYDLLKPVDKNMEIASIRLTKKTGGRTDKKLSVRPGIKAAILVCSDSTAAGTREDKSGLIIKEMLEKYKVDIVDYHVLPDDEQEIHDKLKHWVNDDVEFIFTTGGTGLGPRDNTVNAVKSLIERDAEGIAEAMRSYGMMRTPLAMLSRSVAGAIGNSLVVTLPGSSNGARESLEAILPGVFHARKMLLGGGH
ncbi:MAG: bifunctional molybdenum cofactor biosynthesis protein MoaC/MoaB [Spirochaetota bacterium]|nr:bifunctional molybdenum cofactor biosynthesis protein MoaC/MoaB [Spirochaetota bacterium]